MAIPVEGCTKTEHSPALTMHSSSAAPKKKQGREAATNEEARTSKTGRSRDRASRLLGGSLTIKEPVKKIALCRSSLDGSGARHLAIDILRGQAAKP